MSNIQRDLNTEVGTSTLPASRKAGKVDVERNTEEMMRARGERSFCVAHVLPRHLSTELVGDQFVVLSCAHATGERYVYFDEVRKVAEAKPLT